MNWQPAPVTTFTFHFAWVNGELVDLGKISRETVYEFGDALERLADS